MGRIFVVDGTSNAGKTTLCENLEKNVENIAIIPGASLFAKIHSQRYLNIPPIPMNADEEKKNQEFFFKLELDRLVEANKLASLGKDVFMDRGVLEILSVAYSFEEIKNWKGIYANARLLYERFITMAEESKISLPDGHIWLQASSEEVKKRNKARQIERGKALSENDWIEASLIDSQIEFFNKLCIPENEKKVYPIDTNYMTKQNVMEKVCELFNLKEKEMEREND